MLKAPQGCFIAIRKGRLIKKIHRGIPADGHFRKNNQLGPVGLRKRTIDCIEYATDITAEIPDHRVDLTEG
jgi:hypothetical protein